MTSLTHGRHGRWLILAAGVLAMGAGFFLAWREHRSGPEHPRLILVGMDALTWDLLTPMLQEGRLPHFQALIQGGVHGPMKTLRSTYLSAAIWTTILTGKVPKHHGIMGFFSASGFAVNSTHRKTKFLPQILSDHGITTAAVGFWATWPAEKIHGWIVSDLASYGRFMDVNQAGPEPIQDYSYLKKIRNVTWPEDLVDEILPVMQGPQQFPRELYQQFMPMTDQQWQDFSKIDRVSRENELSLLKFAVVTDLNFHRAGLEIVNRHRPAAYLVYFQGPDIVEHFFWKYMEPESFPGEVNPVDANRLGEVIKNYYEFMDRQLGEILALADENTLVVVCSDHGQKRVAYLGQDGLHSGEHRMSKPPGILILKGPGVKADPDHQLSGAVVVDVTPTLLYLLGLPVAKDMDGKILLPAVTPDFQTNHPLRLIPTFDRNLSEPEQLVSPLDREQRKRLRALGYVDDKPSAPAPPEEPATPVPGDSTSKD